MKKIKISSLNKKNTSDAIGVDAGGLYRTPILPTRFFSGQGENKWAKMIDVETNGFVSSFLISGGYYSNSFPGVMALSISVYNSVARLKLQDVVTPQSSYRIQFKYTISGNNLKVWVKLPSSSNVNIVCLSGNYLPLNVLGSPPEDAIPI